MLSAAAIPAASPLLSRNCPTPLNSLTVRTVFTAASTAKPRQRTSSKRNMPIPVFVSGWAFALYERIQNPYVHLVQRFILLM